MARWDPVDIDPTDRDGLEDDKWDVEVMNDLQNRFEELRQFNIKYNKSHDEATREEALTFADATRTTLKNWLQITYMTN